MRSTLVRLAVLCAGIAAVVSCDAGPGITRFGNGISGGPTGTAPVVPAAPGSPDSNVPLARFVSPPTTTATLVNVGDSIFVSVRLNDDRAVGSVTLTGFKETGDVNLGTFVRIARYTPITVPAAGNFRAGLIDTTVTRYLKPATPVDTTIGPLYLEATVTDSAGNTYTARLPVNIVTGPKITITAPTANDSVPVGVPMSVSVRATHQDGVDTLVIRVLGENTASWPTKLDTTIRVKFPAATKDTTYTVQVTPPADAPLRGRVTISANAVDVNRNPGSASPIVIFLRARGTLAPRVYQTVPLKLEISDSISVTASGDGITQIGIVLLDSANNVVTGGDTVTYAAPFTSNRTEKLALNLTLADQGRRLNVISFAVDNNTPPNTGWSLKAGIAVPVTTQANASRDTTLITYGRTFHPPRAGVMGDVAVHPNGNVFLSNTAFNLLEVWNNGTKTFTTTGVAVGAQPWGMFVSRNTDTLIVANSGATTISRVCINGCAGGVPVEDLSTTPGSGRIRTRNNVVFQVLFTRDASTGRIRLVKRAEVSYSDRPQYVAQSAGGRIFYSTRPTPAQQAGTIRWLDPSLAVPDPRQIWSYAATQEGDAIIYTIFNADSMRIGAVPPASPLSDTLYLYDHPYGSAALGGIAVNDSIPLDAQTKARALSSDVEMILGLDLASLDLTDTTFVAASGDRNWIAFGEGNTAGGTGRVMMINDPPGLIPGYFSPAQTVSDIVHNASEKVFGLAVDSTGLQAVAHGLKTYMASVDLPFHLRLDGEYDSFDDGAGVAYHPQAKSTGSTPANRVAFSATQSGVIEVIDVAHYNNRGQFITKGNLYGALRATGPLPGDPPEVILKLFGLTAEGLIVIDVRAPDIKAAP